MRPKPLTALVLGIGLVAAWGLPAALSAEEITAGGEPGGLTEPERRILAEVESRWWGWPSEPAVIAPAPKSATLLGEEWALPAGSEVVVLLGAEPSEQESYAASMLTRELVGRFGIACRVSDRVEPTGTENLVVCLGTVTAHPRLIELCGEREIQLDSLKRPESYLIDFVDDRGTGVRWIVVASDDPVGCIHGAFSLAQLFRANEGGALVKACRVFDYPTMPIRSLRGVGESLGMKLQVHTESRYLGRKITGDEIHADELLIPCLDRLARNRINCFHILSGLHNGPELPSRMRHLVEQSHRRGIKVVGGFRPVGAQQGDPSTFPCYADEEQMELVLGHFRQYIEAGCDFVYFMADDYYPDRYPGHCEKCIARFGDLAGEQVFMLNQIVDLAGSLGMRNERILFCPTHYDARSPKDVEYLEAFNADPKLKGIQFTFTYLTEELIEQRRQALPELSYALFYNGPRWLSYYCRNAPNTRAVLADHARNAMYFPIYYGWHAAQYNAGHGWFVNTNDDVRRTFHEVIPRETGRTTLLGNIANYSDSIFKGPVEYALWGHYCWNPATHDTRQSEVAIGEFLFGPGNGQTCARLNRLLLDLTRVAYADVVPPEAFLKTLGTRFELAKRLHQQLREGYDAYRKSVGPGYIAESQAFHARLGIEDMQKYLGKLEHVVEARDLLGGGKVSAAPTPRYAGVVFPSGSADTFLLSGGCLGGGLTGCLGDLWEYHVADDTWEPLEVPPGMMSPRCGHSAVTVGGKVYFFGGTSNSFSRVSNALYEFDMESAAFREIADAKGGPPPERLVHAACADDSGRMWIFGGLTTDRKGLADLWCYHAEENRWEEIDANGGITPGERYGTRLVCVEDDLYLFGGSRQEGPLLGDLFRYSPSERRWTQLEPESDVRPSPRYSPALVSVGKRVYLFGGRGLDGFLDDLYTYDPEGNVWKKLEPRGEVRRPVACPLPLCTDGTRIYLFSGAQSAARYGSWVNGDLVRYDIGENAFTKLRSGMAW